MPDKALKKLAKRYHLSPEQLTELLQILQDDESTQYVLRYRKDLAGNLTSDGLDQLLEESRALETLDKERRKILRKLQEQETLTDVLQQRIESAETMRELIDYYVPYRPRKRSRSRQAISQGLEPLARKVLERPEDLVLMSEAVAEYVSAEGGVSSAAEALDGIFHVVCDWLAEEKSHRDKQRELLRGQGTLTARGTGKGMSPRLRGEFKAFMDFQARVRDVHPSQMLSLMRGRRLKVLDFEVESPLLAMCRCTAELHLDGGADQFDRIDTQFHDAEEIPQGEDLGQLTGPEFLYFCIRQSLCEVLAPILARELERELGKMGEEFALGVVKRNLRSLLMSEPLRGHKVLGLCAGYRTGCKLAALDENGAVIETAVIYPHTPQLEVSQAKETILDLVNRLGLSVVAISAGTASQETEALIGEMISESLPDLRYAVVSDIGITNYAGGQLAQAELPGLTADLQAAVCIGRRMLDPLSELTKVNLRTPCSAQYVQDVNSAALKKAMTQVMQECVAEVGLDVNRAPVTLLRYVPGLNAVAASELVGYRTGKGGIAQRSDLRDVPNLDEDAVRKAAGFLMVPQSQNPLDRSRVHPDHYVVARGVMEQMEVPMAELLMAEGRDKVKEKRGSVNFGELEKQFGIHYLTLKDILDELVDPWKDPRVTEAGPVLRSRRLSLEDLEPDQMLVGTVRKVVDFGAFVDVGVNEDGLVHISELSDRFVRSPYDVVSEGDLIKVRVVEVDPDKRRIALSMRSESSGRRAAPRRQSRPSGPRGGSRSESQAPTRRSEPTAAAASIHRPQSTLGGASRRVQKAAQVSLEGLQKPKKDADLKPEDGGKPKEEPKKGPSPKIGDLLGRLAFAPVERRGKQE